MTRIQVWRRSSKDGRMVNDNESAAAGALDNKTVPLPAGDQFSATTPNIR